MHVFVTYVFTFMDHSKVLCASQRFRLQDSLLCVTSGGVWAVLPIASDKVELN